jgi:hypothetical protein
MFTQLPVFKFILKSKIFCFFIDKLSAELEVYWPFFQLKTLILILIESIMASNLGYSTNQYLKAKILFQFNRYVELIYN